jgi:NitT/TauT family transport system substrate-binding protein
MKSRCKLYLLRLSVLAIVLPLAAMFFTTPNPLSAAQPTIRIGYPQPSGAQLPVFVIPVAGTDKRYGIDVQVIYISGGARLTQSLVSGDIDMAMTGGAVVNGILSGAELVYIAMGVPTYGFSVYARPEIKSVSDLRGKTIGVMTKGASSDHAATALIRQQHMNPGEDVKFLYLGGVRGVLAALDKGIIPAGVISSPTTLIARRMGYKELVNIANLKLPYIHNGVVTRRALVRQNPELIKSFLKAYVAAIKITREEPEVAKKALARFLATNDAAVIDEAYESYRLLFPKIPYMTEDAIRSVLAVTDHPKAAKADPKEFFDNRFLKELEDSGFIQELYGKK